MADRQHTQRFLVLELLDSEIVVFLARLREALGANTKSSIHVTVRGPYFECIRGDDVREYERLMEGTSVLLQGFRTFENSNESIVYLRAHNSRLKKIWWKPDFPQSQFGFNPHVSICRTTDRQYARRVCRFLNSQNVQLECKHFHLVPLTSKQEELFPFGSTSTSAPKQEVSSQTSIVRSDVIRAAVNLTVDYHARRSAVD